MSKLYLLITRILLLTTGGHALIDGIKKLSPALYRKVCA